MALWALARDEGSTTSSERERLIWGEAHSRKNDSLDKTARSRQASAICAKATATLANTYVLPRPSKFVKVAKAL